MSFDTLKARARNRCETNILRLYPAWRQTEVYASGTEDDMRRFEAWRDLNTVRFDDLIQEINEAATPADVDVDAGWPLDEGEPSAPASEPPAAPEVPIYPDLSAELADAHAEIESLKATKIFAEQESTVLHPKVLAFLEEERSEGETISDAHDRLEAEYDRLTQRQLNGRATDEDKAERRRLHERLMKGG
ncbi:MAG: hypothetical protein AAGK02_08050 [Pseudomonadota bacterium]